MHPQRNNTHTPRARACVSSTYLHATPRPASVHSACVHAHAPPPPPNRTLSLQDQERLYEAEPVARAAALMFRTLLGDEHAHTARACNSLALILMAQRRFQEAHVLLQEAVQVGGGPGGGAVAGCGGVGGGSVLRADDSNLACCTWGEVAAGLRG